MKIKESRPIAVLAHGFIEVAKSKFQKTARVAALSALCALFSATGNATVISNSNPYNFSWSSSTTAGLLTGTGILTLTGFNTSSLLVDVTLNNTSTLSTNRLTAFGFGINPDATGVTFQDALDGGMVGASLSSIPSLAAIEVCAFGGANCAGGRNGGILGGASDSFLMYLTTGTITKVNGKDVITPGIWGSSVDIAPIGFKYQTDVGSFEFTTSSSSGTTSGGVTSSGTSVPEPGVLALLSVGLLGQALLIRQRRRRQK